MRVPFVTAGASSEVARDGLPTLGPCKPAGLVGHQLTTRTARDPAPAARGSSGRRVQTVASSQVKQDRPPSMVVDRRQSCGSRGCYRGRGGYASGMGETVSVVRETERKYEADEGVKLPDPANLLGMAGGVGDERLQLEAVYFDTSDLRLLRAGVTLRRRVGGPDEGWHLKLPSGTDSRDEHRLPLAGRGRLDPPVEFVSLTRVLSRDARLEPVAQLDTTRQRWVKADTQGRNLLELVEDQVHAHTMGTATTAVSWREVEVELSEHGQPKLLDRIENQLLKIGVRRSTSQSKLGRLFADRLPAGQETDRDGAADSAGASVLDYLRAQAEEIRTQDPRVRRDAPDAIHRLRVAARRMRCALQAYGKVVDRDATRAVTDELKWLGGELAAARDSEVIEARLTETITHLPDQLVMGPVAAQVTRSLQRRRADGQKAALAALNSQRYLMLHEAIDRLLTDPPLSRRAKRPAHSELPKQVARAWRRTARRMRDADRAAAGEHRDRALHETRKAGKRLRYAVEVAQPCVGKPAKRLTRRIKRLHTLLGDHQDAVVARPVLRELAAHAHLDGGNGFTFGIIHGLESNRAELAERNLPKAWKRLRKSKNRTWLKT